MVNKAILVGRLGRDPETRYTGGGTAVANFSIATSEKFKDKNGEKQEKTEWHKITAWGKLAEICQQYLKKGALVYIEGTIGTREWQDKEGIKRYTTEITARQMQMLGSRSDGGNSAPAHDDADEPSQYGGRRERASSAASPEIDDSDIPF